MKTLNVYVSLADTYSLGWERDDIPHIIHQFNSTKPGERIEPSNGRGGPHWPCPVCKAHGYTKEMFEEQIEDALKRGPERHKK